MDIPMYASVRYHPWIGSDYTGAGLGGRRILILGESHYIGDPEWDTPDFSEVVVRKFGIVEPRRFFTVVRRTVQPEGGESPEERSSFWNSVAFYNYVQSSAGKGPRERPTPEMWRDAAVPFFEVLSALKPHGMVVLGRELWWNLPRPDGQVELIDAGGESVAASVYVGQDGTRTIATHITHPSGRGFSYSRCRPAVAALIKAVQDQSDEIARIPASRTTSDPASLRLTLLPGTLAVCRLDPGDPVPAWAWAGEPACVARTRDELSVVCRADAVPEGIRAEGGWRCLGAEGPFDFALTGILSAILAPLAAGRVPIFAFSTYDTDYIMVKAENLPRAIEALRAAGHRVEDDTESE